MGGFTWNQTFGQPEGYEVDLARRTETFQEAYGMCKDRAAWGVLVSPRLPNIKEDERRGVRNTNGRVIYGCLITKIML